MGKPLIGDAQMLAIYEAMLRLHALQRSAHPAQEGNPAAHAAGVRPAAPIALLASTLLQLRPSDVVITDTLPADIDAPLAPAVLAMAQEATFSPEVQASLLRAGRHAAALAAGHALATAQSSSPGDHAGVTVALLHALPDGLDTLLDFAADRFLPLLVIAVAGRLADATPLRSRGNVEVIRIDADDAVACCRVMQESLLRARNRWGAVVLQAVTLPGAADAVLAFETHLQRRNLHFQHGPAC